ncbi:A118 family predicted phage portal protein [Jatrophihabitans sp. GAS493]|uniref:phage portal protein n=1 Tax=Jatrophihabitans sp. GAS493 TaxID=1907575 RepID=UPI000BB691F0|nr:phage portal protein [Jatrophihabitans sp. GAS493]SOD72729.1 A118 family predicted phage portal protein [Jatrophihabitans sp. GAS493]
MPLPLNGTPWPPKQLAKVTPQLNLWDAWYSGDVLRLSTEYGFNGQGVPGYPVPRGAARRTGVFGSIARWFWGQPTTNGQQITKLHVPIAADICQAGADLLFAEPPSFTVDDEVTQKRLDDLADDTLHAAIAEAAELGGALGGVYLRVTWDKTLLDQPFVTSIAADGALPEFRWGRLSAVTFWTRLATTSDNLAYRHLERHELDKNGVGIIQHALYQGGEGDIGTAVPLTEHPDTAPLAEMVTDGNVISTLSPGLDVVYVANQRPQRKWRNDPVGCNLGRSDLDGVEPLMDALDETYSSWMRDIRLGKSRVFIGESLLDSNGPGNGASFDMDREIFTPLNLLQSANSTGSGLPIQAEQFTIRWQEHQATANQLVTDILRTSGYSSQTFGMDDGGKTSNMTATEVQAKERRSYLTRDRKTRLWRPQLAALVEKMLAVDIAVFGTPGVKAQLPNVAFADSVQESQITLAQTALALRQAEAASTETLVALIHPDWDEKEIGDEAKRITAEAAAAAPQLPDPSTFGVPDDPTNDPASTDPAAPA